MTIYTLSAISEQKLLTCDPLIVDWIHYAIKRTPFDFSVLWGYRNFAQQMDCVSRGTSSLKYPKSRHNTLPSSAIDVAPYPINFEDIDRFMELGYFLMNCARELEIKIKWGAFFKDGKGRSKPHWGHFELR